MWRFYFTFLYHLNYSHALDCLLFLPVFVWLHFRCQHFRTKVTYIILLLLFSVVISLHHLFWRFFVAFALFFYHIWSLNTCFSLILNFTLLFLCLSTNISCFSHYPFHYTSFFYLFSFSAPLCHCSVLLFDTFSNSLRFITFCPGVQPVTIYTWLVVHSELLVFVFSFQIWLLVCLSNICCLSVRVFISHFALIRNYLTSL